MQSRWFAQNRRHFSPVYSYHYTATCYSATNLLERSTYCSLLLDDGSGRATTTSKREQASEDNTPAARPHQCAPRRGAMHRRGRGVPAAASRFAPPCPAPRRAKPNPRASTDALAAEPSFAFAALQEASLPPLQTRLCPSLRFVNESSARRAEWPTIHGDVRARAHTHTPIGATKTTRRRAPRCARAQQADERFGQVRKHLDFITLRGSGRGASRATRRRRSRRPREKKRPDTPRFYPVTVGSRTINRLRAGGK